MPILDIILIVALLVFAIIGTFKGLLRSLLDMCGTLVTFVLALLIAKPVADLMQGWFGVMDAIGHNLVGPITPACTDGGMGPITNFFLDKFAQLFMGNNYWTKYAGGSADPQFITDFASKLGEVVTILICIIAMFIILRIVFALLGKIIQKATSNKVFGKMDRFFGFLFGLIRGGVYIALICVIVYLLSPVIPGFGDFVNNILNTNPVLNVVFGWFSSITNTIIMPLLASIVHI